ncbi:hypothetical protein Cgig2_001083 [Carnegiea gigantea]|uniref:Uncharacterized protein n=1 Tax=Carnegiea gigantea TaxID=171969 RepID=A0A9Q1JMG4_9CARY|nr:hypothetical protein Cgig2_001083 [Carnegiea gigantea]
MQFTSGDCEAGNGGKDGAKVGHSEERGNEVDDRGEEQKGCYSPDRPKSTNMFDSTNIGWGTLKDDTVREVDDEAQHKASVTGVKGEVQFECAIFGAQWKEGAGRTGSANVVSGCNDFVAKLVGSRPQLVDDDGEVLGYETESIVVTDVEAQMASEAFTLAVHITVATHDGKIVEGKVSHTGPKDDLPATSRSVPLPTLKASVSCGKGSAPVISEEKVALSLAFIKVTEFTDVLIWDIEHLLCS